LTVRELLEQARASLATSGSGRLDAEVLLMHVLGVSRAWLFANSGAEPEDGQAVEFRELTARRAMGEPVAYLVGTREFFSLPLRVTPDVLIPRPETELLVETALEFIPPSARWRVADLGTGSGAVALAIASERPQSEVHATEISPPALAVAEGNREQLGISNLNLHPGSWLSPLAGRFHVIVSNPPYVDADDPHLAQGDCRFEPQAALTPGPDGMAAIRQIVDEARAYLEEDGMLVFEHGYDQAGHVREVLERGNYREIESRRDLAGHERITSARWPGSGGK
jgi:release factor glutamine methyltransferase